MSDYRPDLKDDKQSKKRDMEFLNDLYQARIKNLKINKKLRNKIDRMLVKLNE